MSVPAGRTARSSQSRTSTGAPPRLARTVTPQMKVQALSASGSEMLLCPQRNGEKFVIAMSNPSAAASAMKYGRDCPPPPMKRLRT